ncbi:MAG: Ycf66 family protein [Pseudanabaenaceae cyanobacterium]|jgi:hypothetical protein
MINIGGNPLMILLAIIAALGGVGLYFVRNFRPELARDHDIFFSAIALVYGIILLAFNFRMEITTQLAQVLVVGFAGWFAVESLILRQALANQARRTPQNPIVDDFEEPLPKDYRVQIDPTREIAPRRERPATRRMSGYNPETSDTSELQGDVYGEEGGSSRRRRRSGGDSRSDVGRNDSTGSDVIDIDENDIRPVGSRRRPRPSGNGGSPSNVDDSETSPSPSGRRRRRPRPTGNDGFGDEL